MSLNTQIQELKQTFNEEFAKAQDLAALEQLEIRYLGRKAGVLTALLRSLKDAPEGERRELGAAANQLREAIEEKLTAAGWVRDMSREAGGPGAEVSVYTKGEQFIVVMFQSLFKVKHADAPSECPCDVTFSLMSGTQ